MRSAGGPAIDGTLCLDRNKAPARDGWLKQRPGTGAKGTGNEIGSRRLAQWAPWRINYGNVV